MTDVRVAAAAHLEDPGAAGYSYHWPDDTDTDLALCGRRPLTGPAVPAGDVDVFQRCRRPGCAQRWDDHRVIPPFGSTEGP